MFILLIISVFSSSVEAQDDYSVGKITFKGNKTYAKSELSDQLVMHETNIISRWFQKKEPSSFSKEFLESDMERLVSFYQSEGFLNVQTTDSVYIKNKKKQKVNILISIKENDPVKVDKVSFRINETSYTINSDSIRKKIFRRLNLKKGRQFSDNNLYADVSRINNAFVNLGFVYSKTEFDLQLKPDSNLVCVSYHITPGNICQFGETTIAGNKYTKDKIIKKQIVYNEEDKYKSDQLEETRKHLYNLQLFRVASVSPQINRATKENPIPVHIKIEEMPRLMTKFGVGYGTEDKFRAFADITYRGLFGGGSSRLNLYLKHSALTPYYVSLTWAQPQFLAKKLSVSLNPYIRSDNEPGYNTQTIGLNLPFGYVINEQTRVSLTYYLEKVKQKIETDDADVPNPEDDNYLYNKSGLSASLSYNNAKPISSPRKGGTVSFGAKVNGYIFGSDFNYSRLWVDARKYERLPSRFTLALRAMLGGIYSSDSEGFIPVEDRFYSGGGNSNRGWARSMLGPKRDSGSPSGGKSILEMNVEIRRHLFWKVELAVFMDIANVWTEAYHYRLNDLNYSAGGGIRVETPIGPIRFDVGVPVWDDKKSVQYFLSVGQAF